MKGCDEGVQRRGPTKGSNEKKVLKGFLQLFVVPLMLLAACVGCLLLVFDEENALLLKYKYPWIT